MFHALSSGKQEHTGLLATVIHLCTIFVVFHFVFFDRQNGDYTLHTGVLLTSKLHHPSYLVFL